MDKTVNSHQISIRHSPKRFSMPPSKPKETHTISKTIKRSKTTCFNSSVSVFSKNKNNSNKVVNSVNTKHVVFSDKALDSNEQVINVSYKINPHKRTISEIQNCLKICIEFQEVNTSDEEDCSIIKLFHAGMNKKKGTNMNVDDPSSLKTFKRSQSLYTAPPKIDEEKKMDRSFISRLNTELKRQNTINKSPSRKREPHITGKKYGQDLLDKLAKSNHSNNNLQNPKSHHKKRNSANVENVDEFEIDNTLSNDTKSLTMRESINSNNNNKLAKKTILKNRNNKNINNSNNNKTKTVKKVMKDSFRKNNTSNTNVINKRNNSNKTLLLIKSKRKESEKKFFERKRKAIVNYSNSEFNETEREITKRGKLSLNVSLNSSIEDDLYNRILDVDTNEDGGIRKIIHKVKSFKSEMDLTSKYAQQPLGVTNLKKQYAFDNISISNGKTNNSNNKNKSNNNNNSNKDNNKYALLKTPFKKKLSGITMDNTKNTTTCTQNKKLFYDKNGNEIILNHMNSEDAGNEICEVYIMEDDNGNIIKTRKRITKNDKGEVLVDSQGNTVVEYVDDNGNVINVSKYKTIKKAVQQLFPNSLNDLFNEHDNCDVFEVLDNEGKIIPVRKVYKYMKRNNNNNNTNEQDSEDNIEYIDLNGNVVSVQKILKQITKDNAKVLLQSQQEELHKRNKTNLEQAIKNSTTEFNENDNNLKTPIKKSSKNNNNNTNEDETTNSHYYPKTARSKILSSSMSHYYIPQYKPIRDKNKYRTHSKVSRNNRFSEEQFYTERQKKLFFRLDSFPLTGSYNKSTFISSPENIIIPQVEHDPNDKFYIRSSNPVKVVHPPNSMKVSSFGFFK